MHFHRALAFFFGCCTYLSSQEETRFPMPNLCLRDTCTRWGYRAPVHHRDHNAVVSTCPRGVRRTVHGILNSTGTIGGANGQGIDARWKFQGDLPATPGGHVDRLFELSPLPRPTIVCCHLDA